MYLSLDKNKKIILGTAQFGLDYGISNKNGKPSLGDVRSILDSAAQEGINNLDTAEAYGDSSDLIGHYIAGSDRSFNIFTKFCTNELNFNIRDQIQISLSRLNVSRVAGYSFHRFLDFIAFSDFNTLEGLKEEGVIEKVGVSVYGNDEIVRAINDPNIDIIQLAFNIFDSRDEKISLLQRAQELGVEVHVRSIFLQGLFFLSKMDLSGRLKKLAGPLEKLNQIQKESGIEMNELCLAYVESFEMVDKIIVGVDSPEQIRKNFSEQRKSIDSDLKKEIKSIKIENIELLNPANW